MNMELIKEFSDEEVSQAISQTAPLKSPRPDGPPVCLFVDNWASIGPKECDFVSKFFLSGRLGKEVNFTHIALIPKIKNLTRVTEFRPISLCNVLYTIISKTLANRLKKILPLVLSMNQSAFVLGRLISDNVLAAYEMLHSMHSRIWGKVGYMAWKLDMRKAYDRVEWVFLEEVMRKMGFHERWISLVMKCISMVTYYYY